MSEWSDQTATVVLIATKEQTHTVIDLPEQWPDQPTCAASANTFAAHWFKLVPAA